MRSDLQEESSLENILALRDNSLKYHTLVNNLQQGFCIIEMIFDGQGKALNYRFLEVNPIFAAQTGQGIAEKDLPKIFDRFYRGSHREKNIDLSMGLRLYISNQILLKHGGRLSVESKETQGSTFSIYLPFNNKN